MYLDDKLFIYPSFEQNFYYIIKVFCLEVLAMNGEGILTQPYDVMLNYFVNKYCNPDDIIVINEDNIKLKINKQVFGFDEFCKNMGDITYNSIYDNKLHVSLNIPFSGNYDLFFVQPINYKTAIKFTIIAIQSPPFISVQKRYEVFDEKLIEVDSLKNVEIIKDLAQRLNKEYLEIHQQFVTGIFRLSNHPTKIFSSKRMVLDYCFSYLVFNQNLMRIFSPSS